MHRDLTAVHDSTIFGLWPVLAIMRNFMVPISVDTGMNRAGIMKNNRSCNFLRVPRFGPLRGTAGQCDINKNAWRH